MSPAPFKTTNLSSGFSYPQDVLFAEYGASGLICFDGVHAYVVNVDLTKQPIEYTFVSEIILEPAPPRNSVLSLKVNLTHSRVALVTRQVAYVFAVPTVGPFGAFGISEKGIPQLTAKVSVVGSIEHPMDLLKVAWLRLKVSDPLTLSNVIGLLYPSNVLQLYDASRPNSCFDIDLGPIILSTEKEDRDAATGTGLGYGKYIASFDFGCFIRGKRPLLTLFAVDNDAELYVVFIELDGSKMKLIDVEGPVMVQSKKLLNEPLELLHVRHDDDDQLTLLALLSDDGVSNHVVILPSDDWESMPETGVLPEAFIVDSVDTKDPSAKLAPGLPFEYISYGASKVQVFNLAPWASTLVASLKNSNAVVDLSMPSLACNAFEVVGIPGGGYKSVAWLTLIGDDLQRLLFVAHSTGSVQHRMIPLMHLAAAESTQSGQSAPEDTDNQGSLIKVLPEPSQVPQLECNLPVTGRQSLKIFTPYFQQLEREVAINLQRAKDVIALAKKLDQADTAVEQGQNKHQNRVNKLAKEVTDLQDTISEGTLDDLASRTTRVFHALPRERLSADFAESEKDVLAAYRETQAYLGTTHDASIDLARLRAQHVAQQRPFLPTVGGTKFVLSKHNHDVTELTTAVAKLESEAAKIERVLVAE